MESRGREVFDRLYSEARTRALNRPASSSQLNYYQRTNSKTSQDSSKRQTPLTPSVPSSAATKPIVLHTYVNLALPLSQAQSVPNPSVMSPRVEVTSNGHGGGRLELKPVRPEIPEGGSFLSNYERLIRTAQGKRGQEVILTPHYAQLTPVVSTYGFKAGCHLTEWVKRSRPSAPIGSTRK